MKKFKLVDSNPLILGTPDSFDSTLHAFDPLLPASDPTLPPSRPAFNWEICCLCQDQNNTDPLQCPGDSKRSDRGAGYKSLSACLAVFQNLGALPSYICMSTLDEGEGVELTLNTRNAKWHKSCRDKFNNTKLNRALKRKSKCLDDQGQCSSDISHVNQTEETRSVLRYTRSFHATKTSDVCLFCDGSEETPNDKMHEVTTFELDTRVRTCANLLQDSKLLAKLSADDMIAIEAKYHLRCLVKLYNQAKAVESQDNAGKKLSCNHALAFAQLVEYINEKQSDDNNNTAPVFKLSVLTKLYDSRLQQLGKTWDSRVNATKLKDKLLAHFPSMNAQTCGKQVLLAFDEDIGNALSAACNKDDEALYLAKVAQIIRRDIFNQKKSFTGKFVYGCPEDSVPESLSALVQMILDGPNIVNQSNSSNKPAVLSISQLLVFNAVKHGRSSSKSKLYHYTSQETPLPLYVSLMLHSETRKRDLVDKLFSLDLCVSYDHIRQISAGLENRISKNFDIQFGSCPPSLHTNVFTTAAMDNIDHNPSSSTAQDSFHGTGISLIQHCQNNDCISENNFTDFPIGNTSRTVNPLPSSYTHVPPVRSLGKHILTPVTSVEFDCTDAGIHVASSMVVEQKWLEKVYESLEMSESSEQVVENSISNISWSAFHADRQTIPIAVIDKITLLPLFHENAHSTAMICHSINIGKNAVNQVNPGQVPILTLDQPLYSLAKQIQWDWSDSFGENKFVLVLGGLHIEMAALKTLGDWLDGSGWTTVLVNGNVTSSGKAESMLRASHVTRTRHVHQVSAATLYILQRRAYSNYLSSLENELHVDDFESWCMKKCRLHPQFQYWSLTLKLELLILSYVKSLRMSDFNLYVDSISELVPWFFALNHHHYARWATVHLRDMIALPVNHPRVAAEFQAGKFTVHRSKRPFSAIALDQAHEQMNARVKGTGGAVGLTESPGALLRWMVAGPEVARVVEEFEVMACSSFNTENLHHHEQTKSD